MLFWMFILQPSIKFTIRRTASMRNLNVRSLNSLNTTRKVCKSNLMPRKGGKVFSNRQLRINMYRKLVIIKKFDLATTRNLAVKSTISLHRNILKLTWKSPDGETHNQIEHVLTDRRWHSSLFDAWSFRAADCDSDHYLVVGKVTERLAVNRKRRNRFHMERLSLKKLNNIEGKEHNRVEVSRSFADLNIWTQRWILIVLWKLLERI
jgi:hypothetical protein